MGYNDIAAKKVALSPTQAFVGAILAGVFIAFGALCSQIAGAETNLRLAQAAVFPIGLVMVVLTGAELFTGNNLLMYSVFDGVIPFKALAKNWGIVYLGNFVGSILVALGAVLGKTGGLLNGEVAESMMSTASGKVGLSPVEMIIRGILCNVLVCIAVWNAIKAKETAGKILAAYLPTLAFVLCGFEHCIANMYFIPAGMFTYMLAGKTNILIPGAILNLILVTLGNIIGGAFFTAGALYILEKNRKQ